MWVVCVCEIVMHDFWDRGRLSDCKYQQRQFKTYNFLVATSPSLNIDKPGGDVLLSWKATMSQSQH